MAFPLTVNLSYGMERYRLLPKSISWEPELSYLTAEYFTMLKKMALGLHQQDLL